MNKRLFYNDIAKKYSLLKNDYDTIRRKEILIDIYLKKIIKKNFTILDCGCADGYFTNEISKIHYYKLISGCDISPKMINLANNNYSPLHS